MKRLYVLFDRECGLCRACCRWLQRQPAFVDLRFIALQSTEVVCRFPGIEKLDLRERLVVVSDEGDAYQGQYAWVMCLYALREYRAWAQRLANPALLPFAGRVCASVSRHRLALSGLFLTEPIEKLSERLRKMPPEFCHADGACC